MSRRRNPKNDPPNKEEGFNLYFSGANRDRAAEKDRKLREKSRHVRKSSKNRKGWSNQNTSKPQNSPGRFEDPELDRPIRSGKVSLTLKLVVKEGRKRGIPGNQFCRKIQRNSRFSYFL